MRGTFAVSESPANAINDYPDSCASATVHSGGSIRPERHASCGPKRHAWVGPVGPEACSAGRSWRRIRGTGAWRLYAQQTRDSQD